MPSNRRNDSKKRQTSMPKLQNAVTPITVLKLWTQEEAAAYLNLSTRYLRDSSCPKVLLPGNGPRRESLVRYKPEQVIQWVDSWSTAGSAFGRAA